MDSNEEGLMEAEQEQELSNIGNYFVSIVANVAVIVWVKAFEDYLFTWLCNFSS